jgi:hypothetical protein
MSVDDGVSVILSIRIFRRHFIVRHVPLREHRTNTKFAAIGVRRVVPFGNVAAKPGPIVDAQYTVDAAYDATTTPPTIAPTGPASCSPTRAP